MSVWDRVPVIGTLVEGRENLSYQTKLKNKLRRHALVASAAAVLLGPIGAMAGTVAFGSLESNWESIDKAIDTLDDATAEKVFSIYSAMTIA
ncbi:hypothetical protein SAMN05444354_105223 [Stigmatella aurantiaca]|uniref:Uncharacterized protein n=1 Tax=Stigmatella aurantiaca TaxID=41 RepID=A0A1H7PBE7_STIAU|nr:hypothetical protein [Stigmatella aurantiaca]SEL32595.1 hypothetical protein SAMN05444354_105223 [Stigmatella aurantiaca]